MASTARTPKTIWAADALIATAVAVTIGGYFHAQGMSGDFQPLGFMVASCIWGGVVGIGGLICAALGARQKPRSLPTKITITLAGVFILAEIALAVFWVRAFNG